MFVETWKGISDVVGRSERWCRYMAKRDPDPLPVKKVGGVNRLYLQDLEEWFLRHRAVSNAVRPVVTKVEPAEAVIAQAVMLGTRIPMSSGNDERSKLDKEDSFDTSEGKDDAASTQPLIRLSA